MKKLFIYLLGVICIKILYAQQAPQISLIYLNPLLVNPAYTGVKYRHNITLNSRFQWVGFKGAPITQYLSYHGPVKNTNFALGLVLENDLTGARYNRSAFVNLAYSIRVNRKDHRISLGMSIGTHFNQTNFSDLQTNEEDQNDPLRVNNSQISPNVGFGLYYMSDNFYFGSSVNRILSTNNGLFTNPQFRVFDPLFYVYGGYIITINTDWKIKLNSLFKLQLNTPLQNELGISFCWLDKVSTGITYRFHESIILHGIYRFSAKFYAGYSFDFPINGLLGNQWGSHEISITYEWGKKLKRRKTSSCFEF